MCTVVVPLATASAVVAALISAGFDPPRLFTWTQNRVGDECLSQSLAVPR